MRSNRLISAVAIAGLTILSTNLLALEPPFALPRAVHPEAGPAEPDVPSGSPIVSDACPATNLGTLSSGDTIVGSTNGSTDDFVAGCGSNAGGQDEIFEFSVDLPGEWSFDTCTVPACWDTTLEVRRETGGGCPGDFVDCDGDGCPVCYYDSLVQTFLVPTSTYYLIVDGWSTFAYGDFTVTALLVVPGCASDAECDDGLFCNGAEVCDTAGGQCFSGSPPCLSFEGHPAPCAEHLDVCTTPSDPCLVWQVGHLYSAFWENTYCRGIASWVFDDIQASHHTTGVLDYYTTPIVTRTHFAPQGTVFTVHQSLFTVEAGTCNPDVPTVGSQCTSMRTLEPFQAGTYPLPCSGTNPLLPNHIGDFDVCEIDFFMAFRTSERGVGMGIAGPRAFIGGPAAADDFGVSVIWFEDCPPTGIYSPVTFGDDINSRADFANAEVCMIPNGSCCDGAGCSVTLEQDCFDTWTVGTIYQPASCDEDSDGDGVVDPCDQCPGEDDADADDVCDDVDICQGFDDHDDGDGDGVPGNGDGCDRCPDSDDNVPGARDDDDGDGVLNCNDRCSGVDDAVFAPNCVGAIPTISQWGLIVLTLLLLVAGKIYFSGRRLSAKR